MLQRALINNNTWDIIKKKAAIPLNEQSVCAIAIGIPNETIRVPLSNRLSYDRIVKSIEAKKRRKHKYSHRDAFIEYLFCHS